MQIPRQAPPDAPVSVIVPAFDAASTIGPCIDCLVAAGVPAKCVWVVDDGSGDATARIARERGARVIVTAGRTGAAAARKLGAARSEGDPIVFVDADVCVAPDAVRKLMHVFASGNAPDALFGSYDDAPPAPGTVGRVRNLLHHHIHQTNGGPAETFWTGLGAVRHDAFYAVGGFSFGQRMMEDARLGYALRRAGYRIELCPKIQGAHLKRWTLGSMVRTDLLDRAIPWSRLLLVRDEASPSLNVSPVGKLSVVAVGLGVLSSAASVALAVWSPVAAIGALVVMVCSILAIGILNTAFLGLIARRLGRGKITEAIGILWLHYLASGCGYTWVRVENMMGRRA